MAPLTPEEIELNIGYKNILKDLLSLRTVLADLERIKSFKNHQEEIETIFEKTFNTFWNYIRDYLSVTNAIEQSSPKEVFRELHDAHLIDKEELETLYHMTDHVNKIERAHDEKIAMQAAYSLPNYYTLMHKIIEVLEPLQG